MKMTHDERFATLAPAYALGALEADEAASFEAHLSSGCEACAAELDAQAGAIARLPEQAGIRPQRRGGAGRPVRLLRRVLRRPRVPRGIDRLPVRMGLPERSPSAARPHSTVGFQSGWGGRPGGACPPLESAPEFTS